MKAVLVSILAFLAFPAFAQNGLPSSKATADINTLVKCTTAQAQEGDDLTPLASCIDLFSGAQLETTGGWVTIMDKQMKLSNSQSLFVSPSLVTGLYTQTRTKTSTGTTSTARAMGGVYMRALLIPADGSKPIIAAPINECGALDPAPLGCVQVADDWGVELDTRIQTLTQSLSECTVVAGDLTGTCSFTSIIDLILHTTSAHTFNFIFPNVGQGTYTIQIQAAVASEANIIAGSGTAIGAAAFGLGSVTVEAVRLVHNFEF